MNKEGKFPQTPGSFSARIGAACEGLNFMSETDEPVVPFVAGEADEMNVEAFRKAIGAGPKIPVEEGDPGELFARLTKVKQWHTPEQRKNAKKFADLQKLLEDELADLRVFRVGKIRIDVYIAGIDGSGRIAGVKTRAVET